MPQDFTEDKSTLVQVMAWCRQATSHYLSQCWPRSMSPNGVTRPQWVKSIISNYMLWNKFMNTSCIFALKWMQQNIHDDKSTLVQVMARCHRATSHCLSQCWPRSMSPYGITRLGPSEFNSLWPSDAIWRHRSMSTLAQVMACCLTAPNHYLNQCWPIISEVKY